MKNKRPSKFDKGGLYIALCCFALVAAVVGYVGNKQETPNKNNLTKIDTNNLSKDSIYTPPKSSQVAKDVKIEIKDEVVDKKKDIPKKQEKASSDKTVLASNKTEISEPVFKSPVDGKVIADFSKDELVYNDILSDWRTHNGIDISCDKNAAIYAACDGVVSEVYESSLGKTVKIDHQNGYQTIYANLSDQIEVISGDDIKAGDLIGKVGETAVADFTTEPHLHFEILKNNEFVNPANYIK